MVRVLVTFATRLREFEGPRGIRTFAVLHCLDIWVAFHLAKDWPPWSCSGVSPITLHSRIDYCVTYDRCCLFWTYTFSATQQDFFVSFCHSVEADKTQLRMAQRIRRKKNETRDATNLKWESYSTACFNGTDTDVVTVAQSMWASTLQ